MKLSLIRLNPQNHWTQREMNDIWQMHRSVDSIFPEGKAIYRAESNPTPSIMALSDHAPNMDYLNVKGWLDQSIERPVITADFTTDPAEGTTWQFKMTANPSKRLTKKRIGIYDEAEQLTWIKRIAGENGFSLIGCTVTASKNHVGFKEGGTYVECLKTTFVGILRVTDQIQFRNALYNGIGHAKAWGCGLLTIKA
jgi:CRISPR system Cascade subunit CasE